MAENTESAVNLLIVDDSAANLYVIEDALQEYVDNLYTSSTPQTVMDLCVDKAIDIALIDIKMPVLSGIDLLKQIKANPLTSHIVVVLMTGFSAGSQDIINGLEAGAIDYLFKPLDLYIKRAKIQSLIELVKYQTQIKLKNKELEVYQSKLKQAMALSERNKVNKDKFFSNMSHEIRTPLSAIAGIVSLLKDDPDPASRGELLNMLDLSTNTVMGLVNDILDSAKIEEGRIKILNENNDIKECFTASCRVLEKLAAKKNIGYTISVDDDIPAVVSCDRLRINQILMNLIGNAIKFTTSGEVNASLKMLRKKENSVLLEIKIADSGIGIPEKSLRKIFNRFEQAEDNTAEKFGGTGLGLSIVKSLTDLMGGEINVQSRVGVGTAFVFTCWFNFADTALAVESSAPQALSPLNISVLLAEDNKVNEVVAKRIMAKWNIQVDAAENGYAVLEKLKINNYDLILMDSNMPGLGGYDATKLIRSSGKPYHDIPIISFSASVTEDEKREGREIGINDFLSKPFAACDLYNKIKEQVCNSEA